MVTGREDPGFSKGLSSPWKRTQLPGLGQVSSSTEEGMETGLGEGLKLPGHVEKETGLPGLEEATKGGETQPYCRGELANWSFH